MFCFQLVAVLIGITGLTGFQLVWMKHSGRGNILAANQIATRTTEPFESKNKQLQGRLGEGGPLKFYSLTSFKITEL